MSEEKEIDRLREELRKERAYISSLLSKLEKSERHAFDCAKQAGDLAEGTARALGMEWTVVVPDDAEIIRQTSQLNTSYAAAVQLLEEAAVELAAIGEYSHSSHVGTGLRIATQASAKLSNKIRSFLEQ